MGEKQPTFDDEYWKSVAAGSQEKGDIPDFSDVVREAGMDPASDDARALQQEILRRLGLA